MRLEEVQRAVTAAVLGKQADGLHSLLQAGGADAGARLAIHRNHTQHTLAVALGDNFPVTVMLLGEAFFRQTARQFVVAHPPREPRLSRYGRVFPAWLARLEACRTMPFIARVARLEALVLEAVDQPVKPAASLQDLLAADPDAPIRLGLQPSMRLHASCYDAAAIWRACRSGARLDPSLGRRGRYCVQAARRDGGVEVTALTAARFAFRRAVSRGEALESAGEAAGLDTAALAAELAALFDDGLVVAVESRGPPR